VAPTASLNGSLTSPHVMRRSVSWSFGSPVYIQVYVLRKVSFSDMIRFFAKRENLNGCD
jgi:hypothetical protein